MRYALLRGPQSLTRPVPVRFLVACTVFFSAAMIAHTPAQAQGIFLTSVGPINEGMGGAAVAAPIDSAGALNWNPATISGLPRSETEIGLSFIIPTTSLASSVPGLGLSGSTDSMAGATPVPTMAFVLKNDCSQWTWGIGIYGIGGFSANYASSALGPGANPILTPQPPNGIGVGRVYSNAQIYQIAPTVSYALTDKLSFGFAPTIDVAMAQIDPLFLAPPNIVGGVPTYGPGDATRFAWGGGFQLGLYYITDSSWRLGVSFKSPQWFEPFQYNSNDTSGNPVSDEVRFDLPSITSIGASYNGIDRLVWAVDVRYFDYADAVGFSGSGFEPSGAVAGLGWRSVWGVSSGWQYSLTDCLDLRLGYTFIQNPIPESEEQFNVGSALIMEHFLSVGATYHIRHNVLLSAAWTHGFRNSLTGPFQTPLGPVPNTSITSTTAVDEITAGLSVLF